MTVSAAIDKLCLDSPKTGRVARGLRVVGQRLYHRCITPPGTLSYSPQARRFGYDLAAKLGQVGESRTMIAAVETGLRAQLQLDSAVRTARVRITSRALEQPSKEGWQVSIEAHTTEGDIRLVLGVSGVSAELLSLENLI